MTALASGGDSVPQVKSATEARCFHLNKKVQTTVRGPDGGNPEATLGTPRKGWVREWRTKGRLEISKVGRRMKPQKWP